MDLRNGTWLFRRGGALRALACLLSTFPACTAALAELPTLTLGAAIEQALAQNFTLQVERVGPQVAATEVREAWGLFDPELVASYATEHDNIPFVAGLGIGSTNFDRTLYSLALEGWVPVTGTRYSLSVAGDDFADNTSGSGLSEVSSSARLQITQPLWRGFGSSSTLTRLRVAKGTLQITTEAFRRQLMDIITQTLFAYLDLHFAGQNLAIATGTQALASQLLEDNRQRVASGAMAALDLVQAESELALRSVDVIQAENTLARARNRLLGLISADAESRLGSALVIEPPADPVRREVDVRRDWAGALALLPEMRQAQTELVIRQTNLEFTRNQSRPAVDLVASYGLRGIDNDLDSSFGNLADSGRDNWSIGAVVRIPLPNRERDARKVRAVLSVNKAEIQLQQLRQHILLELDDAAHDLETAWRSFQAARIAKQLAKQSLQAEEKKLRVGTSSTFVVLRLQGDLANAERRELQAKIDYLKSSAIYDRRAGRTLQHYKVQID